MTRNPIVNALAAIAYILVIASLMFYAARSGDTEFTVIIPMAIISLFTLSAAVMAYIFLYQPLQLYLEGEKNRAVKLFLNTVAVFGGVTALIFVAAFSGILG